MGHVHSGALGWVGFITFGAIYYLVPRLWRRERLYSLQLVEWHFWIATLGIVLYITAMWVSGIMQGLMWRSYDSLGFLQYSFIETVAAMHPYYLIRACGGVLFLIGASSWPTMSGGRSGARSGGAGSGRGPAALASPAEASGGSAHVLPPAQPGRAAGAAARPLHLGDRLDRRLGRDRAPVHDREHDRAGRRGAAL